MALSQKHRGKILVPWFCSDEWRMVYSLIYSEHSTTEDKENAVNFLRIWKTRTPLFFAGLEGTLTVLEVLLLDQTKLQENVLCSLYATAILRFLNICAASGDRQGTFYKTARKKNLPDWLINIRHDLAHSQKLPSKFMLNLSLQYCLKWLKSMYWDLQNSVIEDYIVNGLHVKSSTEEIIKVFCDSTFAFLNSEDVMEFYFERINKMGVNIKKNTPFAVIQKRILNILVPEKLLAESDTVIDCIIENGSIFLIPKKFMRTGKSKHIPKEVFEAWDVLLQYLEKQNLLMKLIEKLFNVIGNEIADNGIKLKASQWLNEIFKCLLKKQMDNTNTLNGNSDDAEFYNPKNKKMKTSEITSTLNFAGHNPNIIENLDKIKNNVLLDPNEYVEIYLKNLLLVAGCPKNFISDMELAVKSFLRVNLEVTAIDKLYTLEDVDKLLEDVMTQEVTVKDNESSKREINYTINGKTVDNSKRWQKVKDTFLFDGYPLGVLPHQHKNKNPIL